MSMTSRKFEKKESENEKDTFYQDSVELADMEFKWSSIKYMEKHFLYQKRVDLTKEILHNYF